MTEVQKLKKKIKTLKSELIDQRDKYNYLYSKYESLDKAFEKVSELKKEGEEVERHFDYSHRSNLEGEIVFLRNLLRESVLTSEKLNLTLPQDPSQGRGPDYPMGDRPYRRGY